MASKVVEMPIRDQVGISGHFSTGYHAGLGLLCEDPRDQSPVWFQIWSNGNGNGTNDFKKIRYINPDEGESRVVLTERTETIITKGFFSETEKHDTTREIKEILIRRDILISGK